MLVSKEPPMFPHSVDALKNTHSAFLVDFATDSATDVLAEPSEEFQGEVAVQLIPVRVLRVPSC